MKTFAALDFETANQHRSSVCSVGLVFVENGLIVDKYYQLIKPLPNFYSYWNTQVHGLVANDTDCAAEFPELWYDLSKRLKIYLWSHIIVCLMKDALKPFYKHIICLCIKINFSVLIENRNQCFRICLIINYLRFLNF